MTKFLLNGWSFSMPRMNSGIISWHTLSIEEAKLQAYDAISVIGNKDIANVLTSLFGFEVEFNRENIKLNKGDVAIICSLKGAKLPAGATTLPDDVEVEIKCVKILEEI